MKSARSIAIATVFALTLGACGVESSPSGTSISPAIVNAEVDESVAPPPSQSPVPPPSASSALTLADVAVVLAAAVGDNSNAIAAARQLADTSSLRGKQREAARNPSILPTIDNANYSRKQFRAGPPDSAQALDVLDAVVLYAAFAIADLNDPTAIADAANVLAVGELGLLSAADLNLTLVTLAAPSPSPSPTADPCTPPPRRRAIRQPTPCPSVTL